MSKFPIDAPKAKVLRALRLLGFMIVRQGAHIALARENADGSRTPMTIPNHPRLEASTLRTICTQARIERADFLSAYERA